MSLKIVHLQVMMRQARTRPAPSVKPVMPASVSQQVTLDLPVPSNHLSGSTIDDDIGTTSTSASGHRRARKTESRADRDRKTFITLTYILATYLVCWVPFHFVFDCSAINPSLVPDKLYTAAFWMTYVNSTLNPIVYAFSNKEFKEAFKRVLHCCCR